MSEKQQSQVVRDGFKSIKGRYVRVENKALAGTPDVLWAIGRIMGWLELKDAERWPPKGGPLRVDHYTPHQRAFHVQWWRGGTRMFVLLRVGKEWLLFDGETAAANIGFQPEEVLKEKCIDWREGFAIEWLAAHLLNDCLLFNSEL